MVLVQFIAKCHSVRVPFSRATRTGGCNNASFAISVSSGRFCVTSPSQCARPQLRGEIILFINAARIRRWKWELFGTAPDPEITSCHIVARVYSPQSPKFSETSAFGQPRRRASLQSLLWPSRLADANCSRMLGDPARNQLDA